MPRLGSPSAEAPAAALAYRAAARRALSAAIHPRIAASFCAAASLLPRTIGEPPLQLGERSPTSGVPFLEEGEPPCLASSAASSPRASLRAARKAAAEAVSSPTSPAAIARARAAAMSASSAVSFITCRSACSSCRCCRCCSCNNARSECRRSSRRASESGMRTGGWPLSLASAAVCSASTRCRLRSAASLASTYCCRRAAAEISAVGRLLPPLPAALPPAQMLGPPTPPATPPPTTSPPTSPPASRPDPMLASSTTGSGSRALRLLRSAAARISMYSFRRASALISGSFSRPAASRPASRAASWRAARSSSDGRAPRFDAAGSGWGGAAGGSSPSRSRMRLRATAARFSSQMRRPASFAAAS
mmetsp:Transcript_74883/g.148808  ORF Transcript_74883/g.148808 Transcript_74883/m.148808 type:complete len:363 (-) Transcript_74883:179-1267(-)